MTRLGKRQIECLAIAAADRDSNGDERGYVVAGKGGDSEWSVVDSLMRKGLLSHVERACKRITDAGREALKSATA